MSAEDEEIRLRDQFAMQIMQAIISSHPRLKILSRYKSDIYDTTNEIYLGDMKYYLGELEKEMELISDFSYKLADVMRKSRLKSFT